jgi:alkylation response protein AidB-like acyl-CoA dehydrogenase
MTTTDWAPAPELAGLKAEAKAAGLWNLFLPSVSGPVERRLRAAGRAHGRSHWGAEVMNCSAPDTGNMEVLHAFGSQEQKDRWLTPLLEGEIRSASA